MVCGHCLFDCVVTTVDLPHSKVLTEPGLTDALFVSVHCFVMRQVEDPFAISLANVLF